MLPLRELKRDNTEKKFALTIVCYYNRVILTVGLVILRQAPQAVERLKLAYPRRPYNFDQVTLHEHHIQLSNEMSRYEDDRNHKFSK